MKVDTERDRLVATGIPILLVQMIILVRRKRKTRAVPSAFVGEGAALC